MLVNLLASSGLPIQRLDAGVDDPNISSRTRLGMTSNLSEEAHKSQARAEVEAYMGAPAAAEIQKEALKPRKLQSSEVTGKATSTPRLLPSQTKAVAPGINHKQAHLSKMNPQLICKRRGGLPKKAYATGRLLGYGYLRLYSLGLTHWPNSPEMSGNSGPCAIPTPTRSAAPSWWLQPASGLL